MDKLKKSGENVTNFIIESLKGTGKTTEYVNGKLPIVPEMRNLSTSTTHSMSQNGFQNGVQTIQNEVKSIQNGLNGVNNGKDGFAKTLLKFLGVLLLIFVIYKVLQSYPDIMTKIQTIFGKVEKEIKNIKNIVVNPMFNVSNNLNSNEILDYLLGTKKEKQSEWCFLGESNGERVCTLSQGNQCMSGNIFPSQNICVNPKLKS